MVQFKALQIGIQVNGATIHSILEGLGAFKELSIEYLSASGIDNVKNSHDAWYDQQKWLDAMKLIYNNIGEGALFQIGTKIPSNAEFPDFYNIKQGLEILEIAYHINHRNKDNEILYDENREPKMLDGIGNYKFVSIDKSTVKMICDNPYPDSFDRGIINAIVRKFNKNFEIIHDNNSFCRNKGERSCTYIIKWH